MKYSEIYEEILNCKNNDQVFDYFCKTINSSITLWNYFVNWEKVFGNVKEIEIDLNIMNYLIGKDDVENEFKILLRRYPSIIRLIPVLIACRDSDFTILTDCCEGKLEHEEFKFQPKRVLTENDIEKACQFSKNTGILDLFKNKVIKNTVDYVIGVEVGLDSNGRKNRGGTQMELIVEDLLKAISKRNNLRLMSQATSDKIKAQWGMRLKVDKTSRRFDFAIQKSNKLILIETNYYGEGGSKLKATAGEYKALYDFLSEDGHTLIWITDGLGWKSTLKPLREAFDHIDYTLNLDMVCKGLLEKLLIQTV